jgi:hypothetical protein
LGKAHPAGERSTHAIGSDARVRHHVLICAESLSLRLTRHDHETASIPRESIPASVVTARPSGLPRWQELALGPLGVVRSNVLSRARLGDDEDLVAESLRHQPHRDPSERLPDELFNARCGEIERHNRNLLTASAQLNNLSL